MTHLLPVRLIRESIPYDHEITPSDHKLIPFDNKFTPSDQEYTYSDHESTPSYHRSIPSDLCEWFRAFDAQERNLATIGEIVGARVQRLVELERDRKRKSEHDYAVSEVGT
jgi:hypothetical protein